MDNQAKCCTGKKLSEWDVATFFMNSMADDRYGHFMIANTAPLFTKTLENDTNDHADYDSVRLNLDTMHRGDPMRKCVWSLDKVKRGEGT